MRTDTGRIPAIELYNQQLDGRRGEAGPENGRSGARSQIRDGSCPVLRSQPVSRRKRRLRLQRAASKGKGWPGSWNPRGRCRRTLSSSCIPPATPPASNSPTNPRRQPFLPTTAAPSMGNVCCRSDLGDVFPTGVELPLCKDTALLIVAVPPGVEASAEFTIKIRNQAPDGEINRNSGWGETGPDGHAQRR